MTENHEAERAVLAAVLMSSGPTAIAAYRRLAEIVRAEDFDEPRNADIWRAIGRVVDAGRDVDLVTVCAELAAAKRLNAVGDRQGLRRLVLEAELSMQCDVHAEIVRACAVRRRALEAADAHRARILAGDDVAASFARMEVDSREGITAHRDLSAIAAVDAAWSEYCDDAARNARYGIAALDGDGTRAGALGGLFGGQLTALGAVPCGGKTALAATATVATAAAGGRVLFAALEMPREDIVWRMVAGFCRRHPPSVDRIRARSLSGLEIDDLQRASRDVAALPILIDDAPTTADAFCALARAEHSRAPLSLIVVDYLHLFHRDAADAKRREDEVIRRHVYALKTLAKALKVPVLMLVQFNRGGAKSERPTMFDAFGGSAIEQGADNVVILVPDPQTRGSPLGRVTVFVDKRRGGAPSPDGVAVLFDRTRQRMRDLDATEYPRDTRAQIEDDGDEVPPWGTLTLGGDAE